MKGVNVTTIAYSSFIVHQRLYLQPAIVNTWERMQFKMVEDLKESEEKLVIGGDARNDSPGHTAKKATWSDLYTFARIGLYRSNLVKGVSSPHSPMLLSRQGITNPMAFWSIIQSVLMMLPNGARSFKERDCLATDDGVGDGTIITDRHMQVTAWIREELTKKEDIKHYFDVWHISKGIKKKLRAAAAKKDCGLINIGPKA
ncbi:hypothetical protein BSL78_02737 [Apostichopus japonicus]|uniref:Uncharacterized protein n=1 Tax=Stichopus japonicus TaxID=307972 RepID=A0A2G8LJC8_STIJA|nr:hypothetical protein BSL78_02737 [Apostichopus japonicus]